MVAARWLNIGTEPGVAAGLAAELLLLAAIAFSAFGPAALPLRSIARQAPVRWVVLFLAFSCCSLLWSATVSPSASFLYWCAMAADVAIVALLLRSRPVDNIASSLMRGFIASTCLLALIAWIMPGQEDLRLGDQDYFNTNQIGNLCALAIFMAQCLASRKEGKWRFVIAFLTITLLRSLSKATIVAFVVAEAFLLLYDRTLSRRKKAFILVAAVLLIVAFGGLIAAYVDVYTTTGNQAETLTGRTAIWAYTLNESLDKPWIGNGIDAMWKVFPPSAGNSSKPATPKTNCCSSSSPTVSPACSSSSAFTAVRSGEFSGCPGDLQKPSSSASCFTPLCAASPKPSLSISCFRFG